MIVEVLEGSTLRLKQIERIFQTGKIDTSLILRVYREQEAKKIMASSRAHQFQPDKTKHRPEINLLQVSGREFSQSSSQFSPNRLQSKTIRQALDRPLSQIIEKLSKDNDRRLFQRELIELRRYSLERESISVAKNASSLKELEVVRPARYDCFEQRYCEDLVCRNPAFLRKVLVADKEVRRQQIAEYKQSRPSPRKPLPVLSRPDVTEDGLMALFREMQTILALSAGLVVLPSPEGPYKAFVQPGNNGPLIKSLLLSRPWWALRSEAAHCNLIWTEWKNSRITGSLPKQESHQQHKVSKLSSPRKQLHPQAQQRCREVSSLIGERSTLWTWFQPSSSGHYFSFGKKISSPKWQDFLAKTFPGKEYQYIANPKDETLINHVPGCLQLHAKKWLYSNLKSAIGSQQALWQYIPQTYHVATLNDEGWLLFKKRFEGLKGACQNIWICKPGQNSNRGNGISISDTLGDIQKIVVQRCQGKHNQTILEPSETQDQPPLLNKGESTNACSSPRSSGSVRSLIIQKYMEQPLLFKGRKCDLRCFIVIVSWGHSVKGYWFQDGYLRTSSQPFSLEHLQNRLVHLTNDAVQKKGQSYGKHEHHNKISLQDFEVYLQQNYQKDTFRKIMARIKEITRLLIRVVAGKLNPSGRRHTFQLFGLDFMLDRELKPYLIEANSNPCLEVAGTVLGRIIPSLLEQVLRVAVDPLFPPPRQETRSRTGLVNPFQSNKMQLMYDSNEESACFQADFSVSPERRQKR